MKTKLDLQKIKKQREKHEKREREQKKREENKRREKLIKKLETALIEAKDIIINYPDKKDLQLLIEILQENDIKYSYKEYDKRYDITTHAGKKHYISDHYYEFKLEL